MKGKPNYWQGKFVLNPNTLKISWAVWNVEIFVLLVCPPLSMKLGEVNRPERFSLLQDLHA